MPAAAPDDDHDHDHNDPAHDHDFADASALESRRRSRRYCRQLRDRASCRQRVGNSTGPLIAYGLVLLVVGLTLTGVRRRA